MRHTFVELVVAFPDASVQLTPAPRFAAAFAQEFLEVYAATNNKFSTLAAKKSAFKHHLLPAAARASWHQPAPAGSCDASQGKFPTVLVAVRALDHQGFTPSSPYSSAGRYTSPSLTVTTVAQGH